MSKALTQGLILGAAVGLVAGFFVGRMASEAPASAAIQPPAAAAMPPQGMPLQPAVHPDLHATIFQLEQATARDPKDVQAWIALGNACFDAHQPQKSVEAYAKALALDPKNVSVLTDQGVMYREMKAFDKAIANFQAAQKLQPDHLQSLFNLGVVYGSDLQQKDKARKSFQRVIEKHPGTPQATEAKAALEKLGA